jgi:hypothetical protein
MADIRDDEDRPLASHPDSPVANEHREALDADDIKKLKANPSDRDGRLDINIDQSFPASDPAAITQPRVSTDPPPGGKYD